MVGRTVLDGQRTHLRYCIDMQKALRTLVFCNKIETCRKVENVLKRSSRPGEHELLVLPYHGAIEDGQRVQNLKVAHSVQTPAELLPFRGTNVTSQRSFLPHV